MASEELKKHIAMKFQKGQFAECNCMGMLIVVAGTNCIGCGKSYTVLEQHWENTLTQKLMDEEKQGIEDFNNAKAWHADDDEGEDVPMANSAAHKAFVAIYPTPEIAKHKIGVTAPVYATFKNIVCGAFEKYHDDWDNTVLGEDVASAMAKFHDIYTISKTKQVDLNQTARLGGSTGDLTEELLVKRLVQYVKDRNSCDFLNCV